MELKDKIKILKTYIDVLDKDNEYHYFARKYFLILYNFLFIEQMFLNDVKAANKEINKILELEELSDPKEIYQKFLLLYDNVNSQVRNNVETFDSIESIRQFLKNHSEVYSSLIKSINCDSKGNIFLYTYDKENYFIM